MLRVAIADDQPMIRETHVSRILTKLDLRDRAQLVVAAYEAGLVVPGRE